MLAVARASDPGARATIEAMPDPAARTRPPAPAPPIGWLSGPPDFVGVGTARSGTTWWDSLITSHPDVARAPGVPKEVHFFDERWADETRRRAVGRVPRVLRAPAWQAIAGEWTPGYMLDAWTPRLLRRAAPDARLLVLVRDPVERFLSGRTLAENRFTVGSTARAAANAAFGRGLYADQLLRLWRAFPREQVLVLQYERCLRRPARRAATDLHVPRPGPGRVGGHRRRRASERLAGSQGHPARDGSRTSSSRRYAPENERLAALLPDLDLSLWAGPT